MAFLINLLIVNYVSRKQGYFYDPVRSIFSGVLFRISVPQTYDFTNVALSN